MPFDVEMPDGTIIEDVPDGTSKDVIRQKWAAMRQREAQAEQTPAANADVPISQRIGDLTSGINRGIGRGLDLLKFGMVDPFIGNVHPGTTAQQSFQRAGLIQPTTDDPTGRFVSRVGEDIGAGAFFGPAAAGLGILSGTGAATAQQQFPGNQTAETVGQLGVGLGLPMLAMRAPAMATRTAERARALFAPDSAKAERKAINMLAKDLRSSKTTPADVADRLTELGDKSVLADVNENLLGTARATATVKGPGRQIAKDFLDSRTPGASARLVSELKNVTGKDADVLSTVRSIVGRRKAESAPLYAQADAQAVPVQEVADLHNKLIAKAAEAQGTRVGGAMKRAAGMLKTSDGQFKTNIRQLHLVKKELDDIASRSFRAGQGNLGKEVQDAKNLLSNSEGTGIMERASPAYRQANKIFADETSVKNAVESGLKVLRDDADVAVDALARMSSAEKDAYISGAVKAVRDKVLSGNKFNNDLLRERLRNAFPDDDTFNKFITSLEREKTFARTKGTVLGGSPTANKLSDIADVAAQTSGVIRDLAANRPVSATMNLLRRVLGGDKNIPKDLQEPLAKLLLTPDGSRRAVELLKKKGMTPKKIDETMVRTRTLLIAITSQGDTNGNQVQQ